MHNCLFIFERIKSTFFFLLSFVKCELNKHLTKNTKVIEQKDCNIAFLFFNIRPLFKIAKNIKLYNDKIKRNKINIIIHGDIDFSFNP